MSISQNFGNVSPSLLLDFANTKQLDNRITFTRSTPAVYYDGKTTAMAEQNLLLQSQTFDNGSWTKQAVTVTADSTTAPDGTTTADTLSNSATTAQFWLYQALTLPIGSTLSIYAKAGTANFIGMSSINGNTNAAVFNLSTGAVASSATDVTASIASVGNGWYRCSIVNNTYAGNYVVVSIQESDLGSGSIGSYTGTGKNIYIWGIQAEARRTLTAYTATTTQPITNYIPVLLSAGGNQARFDCNPTTGESLGLLVEEQRTNVCTYSSEFSPNWGNNAITVQSNVNVAPDGTQTADCLVPTTASTIHYVYPPTGTLTISTVYTYSVYAKANGFNYIFLQGNEGGGSYPKTFFNLSNGTIAVNGTGYTNSITSVGNGWYKCSITFTTSSTSGSLLALGVSNTTDVTSTGNGFSGMYVWGSQVEVGSFVTSYIPTTSASATRTADVASMTGTNFSSWYNQAEGTTYTETSCIGVASDAYNGLFKFDDGTFANRFGVYSRPSGSGYGAVMTTNSTTVVSLEPISGSTATVINNYSKVIFAYKVNDFGACRNASTVTTDASGNVAVVNTLFIGVYDQFLNGYIKKISYYPLRLSNTNVQALTS